MLSREELLSHKMKELYLTLAGKVTKDIKQFKEVLGKIDLEYNRTPNSIVRLTNDGKEAEGIIPINIEGNIQYARYKAYSINGLEGIAIELTFGIKNQNLNEDYDKSAGFVKYSYFGDKVHIMETKNEAQKVLSDDDLVSPRMYKTYANLGNKIANEMSQFDELRKMNIKLKNSPNSCICLTEDGIKEEGTISTSDDGQYAKYKAYTDFESQGINFKLEFINKKDEKERTTGLVSFSYLDRTLSIWEVEDELSLQDEEEKPEDVHVKG